MTAATLPEAADEYVADHAAPGSTAATAIRRAFLAGALAAATDKRPRDHVLAELVQYGKTIGSVASGMTPEQAMQAGVAAGRARAGS